MKIREAEEGDLPGILTIYNEVIANSTAVYTEEPSSLVDRLEWFAARRTLGYPVLVAEEGGEIRGFGSFGEFRAWPCYRRTVEHSVHVHAAHRGRGLGQGLLTDLILRAGRLNKHVLIAGIDADNANSLKLHRRMGFEDVAYFKEVGRKFDRWLDLIFMQRFLT